MYKVYEVPSNYCYSGFALVAAESAEEATEYIKSFKKIDQNNKNDSYGWDDYVTENDVIEYLQAEYKGIIYNNIRYVG